MAGFLAVIGLSLVTILVITVFILTWRKRRLSTPEAAYQRDMRGIQLRTYSQTKPRYTRQIGNPPDTGTTSGW